MLTVTQLARKCSISRATILYYEREGLLQPTSRSDNGYRWYGEAEVERLQSIVAYRSYGIPVVDIKNLLNETDDESQTQILKAHFIELEKEIEQLRAQQKAIVNILQEPELFSEVQHKINKERWVAIMSASGLDEDAMTRWHQQFEQMEPQEHQRFLESLGIEAEEIKSIRKL